MQSYPSNEVIVLNNWSSDNRLPGKEKDRLRLLFCRLGNARLTLNRETYELKNGRMLICFPGDTLEVESYGELFSGCYLSVSHDLLDKLFLFSPYSWKTSSTIKKTHLLALEEENIQLLLSYFNLLEIRLKHSALTDAHVGLYDLLSTFIRDFLNIAAQRQQREESTSSPSANILFNKFIRLLYSSSPQKQSLEYYANQLCITPKYLSIICKKIAGETASAFINRYLMDEIRNQLKNHSKPIQTIADELGFANQSFFGKYVKAHLGMTASQFRESRWT